MNEIVILSGKGGTGKTSIAAALGAYAESEAVVIDCDVDAANMHLLYSPIIKETDKLWCGDIANIDYDKCCNCGFCKDVCYFNAIDFNGDNYFINEDDCEGCALCNYKCPSNAIAMKKQLTGDWYISESKFKNWFVHAKLGVGQENSGKLVDKVKSEARRIAKENNVNNIIIDGPPGIGCTAISSLSKANKVIIVAEASNSGIHDLIRLVDLIKYFEIPSFCIINKSDLNINAAEEINCICNNNNIPILAKIKYSKSFTQSLNQGITLIEYSDEELKNEIIKIWNLIKN